MVYQELCIALHCKCSIHRKHFDVSDSCFSAFLAVEGPCGRCLVFFYEFGREQSWLELMHLEKGCGSIRSEEEHLLVGDAGCFHSGLFPWSWSFGWSKTAENEFTMPGWKLCLLKSPIDVVVLEPGDVGCEKLLGNKVVIWMFAVPTVE